jgi:hypothetical protein
MLHLDSPIKPFQCKACRSAQFRNGYVSRDAGFDVTSVATQRGDMPANVLYGIRGHALRSPLI